MFATASCSCERARHVDGEGSHGMRTPYRINYLRKRFALRARCSTMRLEPTQLQNSHLQNKQESIACYLREECAFLTPSSAPPSPAPNAFVTVMNVVYLHLNNYPPGSARFVFICCPFCFSISHCKLRRSLSRVRSILLSIRTLAFLPIPHASWFRP